MILSEKIFAIRCSVLLILVLIGVPFSRMLFIFCTTLFSAYYFAFGFSILNKIEIHKIFKKNSYNQTTAVGIVFSVMAGLWVFSPTIIAILFKVMSWPGASQLQISALISILLAGIPSAIIFITNNKNTLSKNITIRSALFLIILVFFWAL